MRGSEPQGQSSPELKLPAWRRRRLKLSIGRLKQWRGLAMRACKLAVAYQAALHVAAILIWSRG